MKWLIYKHVNKINGKIYIGQTKQKANTRWRNGLGYLRYDSINLSVFARAIKKYGWESFEHYIVEENIKTQEEANLREMYWINFFRSYIGYEDCNGYNMTLGGHSGEHLGYPVYQIDKKNMKVIREFPSTSEASRFLSGNEGNSSQIRRCCEGLKSSCKGYFWCYKKNYSSEWKPKDNKLVSPIFQINDELEIVRRYDSIIEAERLSGFSRGSINQCCSRKMAKSGGFYWCYVSDYSADWKPATVSFQRNAAIYCFETGEIYQNSKEASGKTKANRGHILHCCKHIQGYNAVNGLHFCYAKEKDTFVPLTNLDESPVVCINTKTHYKTISKAAKMTGTSASGISACCNKRNKTANGLSWCFERDYSEYLTPNNPKEKIVICVETQVRYKSTMEVTRELGIPHGTLGTALKNHSATHGLHFCYEDELNTWKPAVNKNKRPIICVETGKKYESSSDAEKDTGVKRGNIFNGLKNGGTAGGFHWIYAK